MFSFWGFFRLGYSKCVIDRPIQSDERGMVDAVAAYVSFAGLIDPQTTVVLHLDTEVLRFRLMPEIKAPRYLHIRHERGVSRVDGVDVIIEIDEGESASPRVGIEQLEGRRDAVGSLVGTSGTDTSEIIENLEVGAGS